MAQNSSDAPPAHTGDATPAPIANQSEWVHSIDGQSFGQMLFNPTLIGVTVTGSITLSAPPPIGNITPNTGAFTNLTVSSNATFSAATYFGGPVTFAGGVPQITGYLPLAGGTMTGPLIYTATGGTTPRSVQDRFGTPDAHLVNARDFGCACDGVTDDGAALNAALASLPPGTVMWIPASLFTSTTIVNTNGIEIMMPPGQVKRPSVGSTLIVGTTAIIGTATLSPVLMVGTNQGRLTNVWVTRNGTPATTSVGIQLFGENVICDRVYSYNHGICLQAGAPQASPVLGQFRAIRFYFYNCFFWNCIGDYVYLINSPEMVFFGCTWGMNGAVEPGGARSCITWDGDNNGTGPGNTNGVALDRCQFNSGHNSQNYVFRFFNCAEGGFYVWQCYTDGAIDNFIFIDPGCVVVNDFQIWGSTIQMPTTCTFISDTGSKIQDFQIQNNNSIAGGPSAPTPALFMSGVQGLIQGNVFNGGFAVQLDSMTGGSFMGNSLNTEIFTGTYTGAPFIVAVNSFSQVTQTAAGTIYYLEPAAHQSITTTGNALLGGGIVSGTTATDGFYQFEWSGGVEYLAQSNATSGAIHLGAGAPAIVWDIPFTNNHGNNLTAHAGGGQTNATQITTQMANVTTCVNNGDSVRLPASVPGMSQILTNNTSHSVQVFGANPDTINGLPTGTGYALAVGATLQLFCYTMGAWQGGVLS